MYFHMTTGILFPVLPKEPGVLQYLITCVNGTCTALLSLDKANQNLV
jgi:hypothetical protein